MFFQKVKLSFLKAEVIASAVAEKYQTRITADRSFLAVFCFVKNVQAIQSFPEKELERKRIGSSLSSFEVKQV